MIWMGKTDLSKQYIHASRHLGAFWKFIHSIFCCWVSKYLQSRHFFIEAHVSSWEDWPSSELLENQKSNVPTELWYVYRSHMLICFSLCCLKSINDWAFSRTAVTLHFHIFTMFSLPFKSHEQQLPHMLILYYN